MKFAYPSGSRPLDGYTIKRGVGRGGFGEVYFATSDAGKEVALKCIQRHLDVELRGVKQCLNLKHNHLLDLYDVRIDEEGVSWVIMEYVSGDTLTEALERHPEGLPLEQVARWFLGIVQGVAHLHNHGIVHRDLKPGNVFIDQGEVKIGDYGLAKFISCSRRSGQTESVGTLHYMAPEIGQGRYGKEIDVYALGVVLYEMLTGRVPFEGESSQEIIMKHLTSDPDLSIIPDKYFNILSNALAKDPEERFSSAQTLLDALEGLSTPRSAALAPEPPLVVSEKPRPATPIFIGDDTPEEITLGPLKEKPAAVAAKPRGNDGASPFAQVAAAQGASQPTGSQPVRNGHAGSGHAGSGQAANGPTLGDEPIARAVQHSWRGAHHWWSHGSLNTFGKVCVLLAVAVVLLANSTWLAPLAMVFAAVYLVYFGIRSIVVSATTGSAALETPAPPSTMRRAHHRRRRFSWREQAQAHIENKSSSERLTELIGSLLLSAIVAAVVSFLALMVSGLPLDGAVSTWTWYAWMVLTCTGGAWAVLAVSKMWEGRTGDAMLRRFVMLIVGLVVGGVAFTTHEMLFLDSQLESMTMRPIAQTFITAGAYRENGALELTGFLVYFALLFAAPRWWSLSDPLRSTRLRLWATLACGLWAWVIHLLWTFPQPMGMILAATIAVSVQLASPWMNPGERARIRQTLREV